MSTNTNQILTRISLAEKSLNNFCNEVEKCQLSLKNVLDNKVSMSEVTDNEFKFGKSVFENHTHTNNSEVQMNNKDLDHQRYVFIGYQIAFCNDYI